MRSILATGLGLLMAASAFANAGGFRGGGFRGRFSGGVFRGGFHGGGLRGGFRTGIGPRRLISPVFPAGFGAHRFGGFRHAYPVYPMGYLGSYWGPYYAPYYEPAPAYAPVAYAAPAPQVIVIAPMAPAWQAPAAPSPAAEERGRRSAPAETAERPASPEQIYFLVPFKDKTVQAAVAYWVEDNTLHYITIAGAHRSTPIADVDREAAEKLNRSRPIQLKLPPPKR